MKDKYNIKVQVLNVLARIVLFLVYYIGLIAIGILMIWGIMKGSVYLVTDMLPNLTNGRLELLIIVCWIGIGVFALMFAIYMIKPLFSFTKDEKDTHVEVTKEDCPQLFDEIRDIAKSVGVRMPKHVYLTTEVNACVFYNTNFWSIFLPVRKNLKIGLGLFDGMSIDEVKSVLAHEFGHFSQKKHESGFYSLCYQYGIIQPYL